MTTANAFTGSGRMATNTRLPAERARVARPANRRIIAGRLTAILATATLLSTGMAGCSSLPRKPADYVEVMTSAGAALSSVGPDLPAGRGVLVGPNFGMRVEEIAVDEEIGESFAQGLRTTPFRAADGHELLLVHMGDARDFENGTWDEKDAPPPAAALVIGGRTRKLARIPPSDSLVVASVPRGAAARLTVADRGRTQSLDLRTGVRDANSFGLPPAQHVRATYDGTGKVAGSAAGRDLKVHMDVSSVSVQPYFPVLGWAEPGRGWLRLRLEQVSSDGLPPDIQEVAVGFFIDPARTFTLAVTGGPKIRPLKGLAFNTLRPAGATYLAAFDVPAMFRAGTLTIEPDGPLFTYRGASTLRSFTDLGRVPDCGGRVECLTWGSRPRPQVVTLALK